MKRLFLIGLMVLVGMANVFGEEIPWGTSKEEIIPEYAWVECGEYLRDSSFEFSFDEDHKLESFRYRFWFKTKIHESNWSIRKFEELTKKYGEPEILTNEWSERYKWETDREFIELENIAVYVVLSFSRK